MKRAILTKSITGITAIDVEKAVKFFTLLNRIRSFSDGYVLLEYTPKGKRRLMIEISEEDASEIIKRLDLKPFRHEIFRNSIVYVPTT